jgi:hypothetical protein
MSYKCFLFICLGCLLCKIVYAQEGIDEKLLLHFSKANKKIEHQFYIQKYSKNKEEFLYQKTKACLHYETDTSFYSYFLQAQPLFLQDTASVGYASCFVLQKVDNPNLQNRWFKHLQQIVYPNSVQDLTDIFFLRDAKAKHIDVTSYPNLLQRSILGYKRSASKKPLLAGFLSALLPGLGKAYIGKHKLAINAFTINSLFLIQSYESIHRLGIQHPLSIINLLFSALFYTSTIYGSYRDAIYFKNEKLETVYQDASNYYSVHNFPNLYK